MQFIIHPGFPKTATTTLQNNIFTPISDIENIGRPYTDRNQEIITNLKKIECGGYSGDTTDSLIKAAISTAENNDKKTIILSDETLSTNGYLKYEIGKRIKSFIPQAKVIFTIRNQLNAIISMYLQSGSLLRNVPQSYKNKHVKLNDYLNFMYKKWDFGDLAFFDYYKLIKFYESLYGKENIHVITLESIRDNPLSVSRELGEILNKENKFIFNLLTTKKQNESASEKYHSYMKLRSYIPIRRGLKVIPYRNVIIPIFERCLGTGINRNVKFSDNWRVKLEDAYAAGNQYLVDNYNLPLSESGYPV